MPVLAVWFAVAPGRLPGCPAPPRQMRLVHELAATVAVVAVPRSGALLYRPQIWSTIETQHDDALAGLGADVGVQAEDFDAEHVADDRFEHRAAVVDQFLAGLLDQVSA